ncbi:MAG TPA: substrate-binding domain-containing protein [Candidatus Limnocylindria bacterium]|nr:substrate-binding domain-containing protein [Candidatus Limnocylindria bacterium]
MSFRRVAAILSVFAILLVACQPSSSGSPAESAAGSAGESAAAGGDCVVGVSWNNYQEERWAKWDEPAIQEALGAGNAEYVSTDAGSSEEQQANDVENLLSQGANVLIILAQSGEAILPSVQTAIDQGVPVIAYDRLIEDPATLYITFDNVGVGRLQAEVIFGLVPEGNYAIIKGNSADANADFLRAGYEEVIGDAVTSGAITIVGETYTDNWDPATAQTNMEQILTDANNEVDAVLSENDGMAGGVVAALEAQGMAGTTPVSGQDGDLAALNRVALGTQSVSVWKDARDLGTAAGVAALALCGDPDITAVPNTAQFDSPGGNSMTSILLTPLAITQDNLNAVVDAGWIDEETLCQGVTAGSVDACP